ncbi:MAG: hypothetical protein WCG27_05100, partial [Pseudomonadota bacterium]
LLCSMGEQIDKKGADALVLSMLFAPVGSWAMQYQKFLEVTKKLGNVAKVAVKLNAAASAGKTVVKYRDRAEAIADGQEEVSQVLLAEANTEIGSVLWGYLVAPKLVDKFITQAQEKIFSQLKIKDIADQKMNFGIVSNIIGGGKTVDKTVNDMRQK